MGPNSFTLTRTIFSYLDPKKSGVATGRYQIPLPWRAQQRVDKRFSITFQSFECISISILQSIFLTSSLWSSFFSASPKVCSGPWLKQHSSLTNIFAIFICLCWLSPLENKNRKKKSWIGWKQKWEMQIKSFDVFWILFYFHRHIMGDDGRSYLSTRFITNRARSPGNSMICLQKFCCTIQVIDVYPIKTKYISTYLGIIQLLLNTG